MEQLHAGAELVRSCLKLNGEERPTMKEVTMELERLRKSTSHPWAQHEIPEESIALTTEESDLYTVPTNLDFSTSKYSGQHSLDSHMIHPINRPRWTIKLTAYTVNCQRFFNCCLYSLIPSDLSQTLLVVLYSDVVELCT